jgi:hypothetical protein
MVPMMVSPHASGDPHGQCLVNAVVTDLPIPYSTTEETDETVPEESPPGGVPADPWPQLLH